MGFFDFILNLKRGGWPSRSVKHRDRPSASDERPDELTASRVKRGGSPRQLHAMAVLLLKLRKLDEALEFSGDALGRHPDNPEFALTHARVLRRLGRLDEALPLLEGIYTPQKRDVFISAEYCKLLVDLGRIGEAEQVFSELERWFKRLANRPQSKENGMTRAFSEAHEKLRRARRE
jgi:tetratricopeptide (TPR) repeat protein